MERKFCDYCGELLNDKPIVVYKDISDNYLLCDDDCLNDLVKDKTYDAYVTDNGYVIKE